MNKLITKSENRQKLVERRKFIREKGLSKRVLESWIDEVEININLDHILQALQNNRNDFETLQIRAKLLTNLQEMASQTNQSYDLLQAINQLIVEYKQFKKPISHNLYIAKCRCLNLISVFSSEIGKLLPEMIRSASNEQEVIDIYLYLSEYYTTISQYKETELILLECEQLSLKIGSDYYLAMTWTNLGIHYYSQFNFEEAKKYLELIIDKLDILCQEKDAKSVYNLLRRSSTCIHYLGRIALIENDFCRAAQYYCLSQNKLEECKVESNIIEPTGATAFYHLRMGELLEACQLYDSAEFHYQKSRTMFNEIMALTGMAQAEMSLARLSKDFKVQEEQILDAASKSLKIGYVRGEAMALFSLLKLYIKHHKIIAALKIFYKILRSQEVRNLTNQTHVAFFIVNLVLRVVKSVIPNKPKFELKRSKNTSRMIYQCPCPDPLCKAYRTIN